MGSASKRAEQLARLDNANALIRFISEHGRRFFSMNSDRREVDPQAAVSRMQLDPRGFCWWIDKYTEKRIYMHYSGRWRGFSDGGTLKNLAISLRDYVKAGAKTDLLGPWAEWMCDGDPWMYGDDMAKVRARAIELGVLACFDASCATCRGGEVG